MTVTSVAGGTIGDTKITVSPAKAVPTNTYKYKVSETDITLPTLGTVVSGYTAWNGTADITATNGYYIAIVECDSTGKADKAGKTIVVALTE